MISPPLTAIREDWFRDHVAYSISKFNMSMVALGLAGELRPQGIAVNTLWPASVVETAAVKNLLGGDAVASIGRYSDTKRPPQTLAWIPLTHTHCLIIF